MKNEEPRLEIAASKTRENKLDIEFPFVSFSALCFFFTPMFKPQKALTVKESRALSGKDVKTLRKKVETQFNIEGESISGWRSIKPRPP